MGKRTRYSSEFKALDALRGELTLADLSAKHGVHLNLVSQWKRQASENMSWIFGAGGASSETKAQAAELERVHAKIGRLVVEGDFLAQASARLLKTGG